MEQSPSWEQNRFSASQEILHILRNRKVPYRIHKCPPNVPVLSQFEQSITPHSTSWRSILILPSNLRLGVTSGLFPSGFPTKNRIYASPPYTLYDQPISFFSIVSLEQHWFKSTDQSAPHYVVFSFPFYLVPLRPKYSPQRPILKHTQPTFFPQCERPSFTPIQNTPWKNTNP
jgi:hypothetical protein